MRRRRIFNILVEPPDSVGRRANDPGRGSRAPQRRKSLADPGTAGYLVSRPSLHRLRRRRDMDEGGTGTVGGLRTASIGSPPHPLDPLPTLRGEGDAPSLSLFKRVSSLPAYIPPIA